MTHGLYFWLQWFTSTSRELSNRNYIPLHDEYFQGKSWSLNVCFIFLQRGLPILCRDSQFAFMSSKSVLKEQACWDFSQFHAHFCLWSLVLNANFSWGQIEIMGVIYFGKNTCHNCFGLCIFWAALLEFHLCNLYVLVSDFLNFTKWLTFLKLQRVKVYRLNDDGKWDDRGTGHVTVDFLEVILIFILHFIQSSTILQNICLLPRFWGFCWILSLPISQPKNVKGEGEGTPIHTPQPLMRSPNWNWGPFFPSLPQ